MADLLRPGDHGLVGGGIGPDGQPDPRVAILPPQIPAPAGIVMVPWQQSDGGGGELPLSKFRDDLPFAVGSAVARGGGVLHAPRPRRPRPRRPRPRHPTVERLREHFRLKPHDPDPKTPPVVTPRKGATAKAALFRSRAWTEDLADLFLKFNIHPPEGDEKDLISCEELPSDYVKRWRDWRLLNMMQRIEDQMSAIEEAQGRSASSEELSGLRGRLIRFWIRYTLLRWMADEVIEAARRVERPVDNR